MVGTADGMVDGMAAGMGAGMVVVNGGEFRG